MKREKEFNNEAVRKFKRVSFRKKNVGFDINIETKIRLVSPKRKIITSELKTGSDFGFLNNIKTISNY